MLKKRVYRFVFDCLRSLDILVLVKNRKKVNECYQISYVRN